MFGISAALTTPFQSDGSVDKNRLNDHIRTVLSQGCASVTFFGTTGEGPSVACAARLDALRAAIEAGIDPGKMVLCLHGSAVADVVDQAQEALQLGVSRFLLPPPSYFDQPELPGLAAWFSGVLSALANTPATFILYHIPQVIGVGLEVDLVAQLKSGFPTAVVGVKDSSGQTENARRLLQLPDMEILIGDERQLATCARIGAAGSISGLANVYSARMSRVLASGADDTAINSLVDTVLDFPVTPAVKSLVACRYQADEWRRTLPPFSRLPDSDHAVLAKAYDAAGDP